MADWQKACTSCVVEKPLAEFPLRRKGHHLRTSECADCRRSAVRQRAAAKRTMLNDLKLLWGCADCGYNKHPDALDFDHLPGYEKTLNLSDGCSSASTERLLDEVNKCEVVCANCHRIRTALRRVHG